MAHYSTVNMSLMDIEDYYTKVNTTILGYIPKGLTLPEPRDNTQAGDNMVWEKYDAWFDNSWYQSTYDYSYPLTIESNDGRGCIVMGKAYADTTHTDTVDYWFLITNKSNALKYTRRYRDYGTSIPSKQNNIYYNGQSPATPQSNPVGTETVDSTKSPFGNNLTGTFPTSRINSGRYSNFLNKFNSVAVDGQYEKLNEIFAHSSLYDFDWDYSTSSTGGGSLGTALPLCYGTNSTSQAIAIVKPVKIPDILPVFDLENVEGIIAYLDNGDDSGKIDPFDPNTPKVTKVTDFKSNFVMNLSKVDNSTTKISVSMSNRQYIDGGVNTWGNYSTYLAKDDEAFSLFNFNNPSKYVQKQSQGVMTITYNEDLSARRYLGQNAFSAFLFGTNDVFNEDGSYNVDSSHSGIFTVTLIPDSNSAVGVKIGKVYYQDFVSSLRTELSRQVYGEGYKFTYSDTGETLYVLFKAIDLDELKNIIDEGYPSEDDEEDDTTGDDNIALYGSGLRTYKITDNAFDEVNKTLWTTNWIEVFKSNTIDPLKCVISCKRIPFTVEGTPTDTLYLANRNIDIGLGSYVSPIKSFNCGRYTLEAIYGNFVDITMARVKVWLPFIGWKELPASEVISRVARTQVGLTSNTKVLSFKYIVDFVDGSCRCVISVNDTERWCFDGNCGIDVPVTSDNHTSAVATALRSGATGVLKIAGGAVATAVGASTMNPMVLAGGVATAVSGQQDLFNAFPTYDYNTSTSPSGYIEGAMNKHIMIIIEYPNAYYPNYYEHKYGKPCYLNLSLGSCSGFTKTSNVDVSNIPCTTEEQEMIKQLLDSGVYF